MTFNNYQKCKPGSMCRQVNRDDELRIINYPMFCKTKNSELYFID